MTLILGGMILKLKCKCGNDDFKIKIEIVDFKTKTYNIIFACKCGEQYTLQDIEQQAARFLPKDKKEKKKEQEQENIRESCKQGDKR